MIPKPIGSTAHVLIDYGFMAVQFLAPSVLGLRPRAARLCYFFGSVFAVVNGLTDHPYAVKRVIPLRLHGQLETPYLPALLLLPWLSGAMRRTRERRFFLGFFLTAVANYFLTDYNAPPPDRPRVRSAAARPANRRTLSESAT